MSATLTNRIAREAIDTGKLSTVAGSQHRRGRSLSGFSGDRDDGLDLFSKNCRSISAAPNDESDVLMKMNRLSIGAVKFPKSGFEDLLGSTDGGKHDYDWLLTPPGTPQFSSLDASEPPAMTQRSSSSVRSSASTARTSRLSVTHLENRHSTRPVRSSSVTRPSISSSYYSNSSNRTSILSTSSASVTSSRPSTPTSRSTLASPRSIPVSRSMPVRSSTPSKTRQSPTSPSESKARPSSSSRPSTPTSHPQIPANLNFTTSRSSSRPSTPTRRNPTPSLTQGTGRSSSVGRTPPANGRSSAPASRASSPGPRVRAPPPPIMLPDFPLDAPPNLRTTLPERPVSARRSRPGVALTVRSNSEAAGPVNPTRRQSSPVITWGRLPDISGKARLHSNGHDTNLSEIQKPIVSASAVRRPIKPATSSESTGFGRTISKKSLDMALRHMDIRHSMGSARALTGTSLFPQSICSSSFKCRSARVADAQSPVNSHGAEYKNGPASLHYPGHETNHDDRHLTSKISELDPYESSRYDAILLKEDIKNTNWLHSLDEKSDMSPVFDPRFDQLPEPFSPL